MTVKQASKPFRLVPRHCYISPHGAPDLATLKISEEYKGKDKILVGNGNGLSIKHVGQASLNSNSQKFKLNRILHVPRMQIQSLSVNKFTKDNNCFFQFHSNHFVVEDDKHRNLCEKHRNLCSKDRLKIDYTDFLGLPCSHYAKEHKHSSVKSQRGGLACTLGTSSLSFCGFSY